jgi:DNA-binding Lrp family transcriptional regulator
MLLDEPPDIRCMSILRQVISVYNSPNLIGFRDNGRRFVWISYKLLHERFKGFSYSERMLKRDLDKLEKMGFIERIQRIVDSKTKIFFYITDLTREVYLYEISE